MAMDGVASRTFVDALYRKVLLSVKASNAIPSEDDDFHYHSKFSKPFAAHVAASGAKLEELVWQLTAVDKKKDAAQNGDDDDDDEEGESKKALFDGPEPKSSITDFVDALLDDASKQLELFQRGPATASAATGLRPLENKPLSFEKSAKDPKDTKTERENQMIANASSSSSSSGRRGMAKPQDSFDERIDNSDAPFVSKLREKVHVLPSVAGDAMAGGDENEDEEDALQRQHPYYPEIKALKYADWQVAASSDPYKKIPIEEASYLWVNSDETLLAMMTSLRNPETSVVAIDLEHHSYRSYLGIVCLMQISTATEDFLVDTLALRGKLQVLNDVFCDPAKVKVLHGSDMDILWLQRDLGLYIVNLFDTGQAARLLQYPRFSLAYLLKRHCGIDADKQYQLADWRIRPLEKNMIKYAREDTRYLLYIYDQLKRELLEDRNDTTRSSALFETLQNSNKICLQVYVKPTVTEDDCFGLGEKLKGTVGLATLTELQQRVFSALYFWRDRIARLEDESHAYVLPNHALMKITKFLPTKSEQLFRTCNPVPPLVRKHAHELTTLISTEKVALAVETAKAAATGAKEAKTATAVPQKGKKTTFRDVEEDIVIESSASAGDQVGSAYAGWPSGKRKAAAFLNGTTDAMRGLSMSFGAKDAEEDDAMDGRAELEKVNALVAQTMFVVSENDHSDAPVLPVVSEDVVVVEEAPRDAIPQSIAEKYQMSNRAKRRKLPADTSSAEAAKDKADAFLKETIGGATSDFQAFDYSAASAQVAGATFNLGDATKATESSKHGGKKKRGMKQPMAGGYNPFVAVRNGDAAPDELQAGKKVIKKMHHMPRSATFR
uniref:HRDC domain-containing protein n=1 Tax=Globisporangium ultimum (strain ATCC 200006 / CBS 805.95 / DAOM BR144) TaxID=431595 RepID=K3WUA1_GLOUD